MCRTLTAARLKHMESIHLAGVCSPWPGYPVAVSAGGFCFLSSLMGLNDDGELLSDWNDLPGEKRPFDSGFMLVDAQAAPVTAQSWLLYRHTRAVMASRGGDLTDMLRSHIYQKDKAYWPVYEQVRMAYEPDAPAPSSGVGVSAGSPDGNAWITQDGIALDPQSWPYPGGRRVPQSEGARPVTSFYSQVVEAGPYLFVAGQIPIDTAKPGNPLIRSFEDVPEEGRFLQVGRSHTDTDNGPIAAQTWFVYDNIRRILEGVGSAMEEIVSVTVFLQDMRDFGVFHAMHERFFTGALPALTVTAFREVGHKPGTRLEIEVTAMRGDQAFDRTTISVAGDRVSGAHAALAVKAGPLLFFSGVAGISAQGRAVTDVDGLTQPLQRQAAELARSTQRPVATVQAMKIFEDLQAIAYETGASLENIAKITLYLEDFADFRAFDAVCRHFLPAERPALSCVAIPRASPVPGAALCVEAIGVIE